ncbi:MAG TPA: hypothetical protein VMT80_01240 [Candidatus Paceibacterota bacterium]|nr:hypothetical protein [Candidatus Paceibacterota bacterium]
MKRLTKNASGLDAAAYRALARLSTPVRVQDFLDSLPMNFERKGETLQSPARVLTSRTAHCFEGALLAAAALWIHGEPPLLLDLTVRSGSGDEDHVVALYKRGGCWGAISKTNHAALRFRDPVYRTVRELALSYFHEWFLDSTGEKTLRGYGRPFNLAKIGASWISAAEDLWSIDRALARAKHLPLFPRNNARFIRRADAMERRAGALTEWDARGRKTR